MITRMSRKYKFYNPEGVYFVSFAMAFWIDVFIKEVYFEKVIFAENHNHINGIENF